MFNKDHIMKIEFVNGVGLERVALFNITKITEEEVNKAIQLDGMVDNPNIIICYKEQFNNVFND
jgi:hypothetical protein